MWLLFQIVCFKKVVNIASWYFFQEISDVATMQVRSLEAQQQSRDKEVTSLRQQLVDFQAQSEEKTVIGLFKHFLKTSVLWQIHLSYSVMYFAFRSCCYLSPSWSKIKIGLILLFSPPSH